MEARRTARRKAPPACLNMANTALFYPPWTVVKNRESTTTDFDDTDFEVSDTEEESPRVSMGSLGYDSNSSISTPDPPTPDDAPKHPYTFHDDKSVQGPSGPHLFRNSISSGSVASTEIDLYFERSPVQSQFTRSTAATPNTGTQFAVSSTASQFPQSSTGSQFPQSSTGSQFPQSDTETTSTRYAFSPCTPQAYATVHPDVSQVEEAEIRKWSPSQVAHWMHIAGYDGTVIDQFLINDITGSVLLSLQIDDLKELGIQSFGKRHQIMTSIDHLRNTMMKTKRPESRSPSRRSYAMSVSPTGEVISRGFKSDGSQVTPGESVSIVGIEQVLPKPHNCSKGENCPKFRRRQRQLEKLAAEFPNAVWLPGGTIITGNPGNPATAQNMLRPTSEAEPSVVASSDVLGPAQQTPRLCEEALNEVKKVDRQESVRQFLNYQHVESPSSDSELPTEPSSKPVISISPPAQNPMPVLSPPDTRPNHMAANLRNLPKLTIPTDSDSDDPTTATAQRTITPSMVNQIYGSPTTVQQYGPFTSARYMGSDDYYRQGTPFSEMDVPVTAIPDGPVARETSQSVPPDMRYGNLMQARYQEPVMRSASTRPRAASTLRRVKEGRPLTPIEDPADLQGTPRIGFHNQGSSCSSLSSDPDVTRSGYMKKRKQTRFLRHEWQDAHFTLRGTNLAMHKDELAALRRSKALEEIDVDDYAVACSSLSSSSKLTAALKKSILRNNHNISKDDAAFAFSLIPSAKEDKKMIFSHNGAKSHHFAVKTRDERIDWMRELMLAKALRKGKEGGAEVQVNGNFI